MRGELDFSESFRRRMALLEGWMNRCWPASPNACPSPTAPSG
jgi:hypothetical protein